MEINKVVAYELEGLLEGVDKETFNVSRFQVDGSPLKAITMRRRCVQLLKEGNKEYHDRIDKLDSLIKEFRANLDKTNKEIDEMEGKEQADKDKEKQAFFEQQRDIFDASLKEQGYVITSYSQKGSTFNRVSDEGIVNIAFSGEQKDFMGKLVDAKGVETMIPEDDLVIMGELFNLT